MFDVDGDGKLSKEEYKAYLRGIGAWGSGNYAPEKWDARWPEECEALQSTTDGISWEGFESTLYGKHRAGDAKADLDSATAKAAAKAAALDELRATPVAQWTAAQATLWVAGTLVRPCP